MSESQRGLKDLEVELLLWIDVQSETWTMGKDGSASHRKSVTE